MTVTNAVIHTISCYSVENKMIARVMYITKFKPAPSTKKKEKRNTYNTRESQMKTVKVIVYLYGYI